MRWGYFQKEALPLTAMFAAEVSAVGLNIIFKAASAKGMSNYVFILYTYVSAALCLLPFAFFHGRYFICRSVYPPSNKLCLFFKLLCLAAIGVSSQICEYKGLEFSCPTLSAVISNLTPAFTFIVAVLFRVANQDWKSRSTIAKIVGTIVCIIGALIAVLYKGPILLSHPSSGSEKLHLHRHPRGSSMSTDCVLGGFLFCVQHLCHSISYVMQAKALKIFPSQTVFLFIYYICTIILATPVCLLAERNLTAWTLRTDMALLSVICAGFMGQSFTATIRACSLRQKGPVYVSSFRRLSIVIEAAMGFILLGDPLHLGSVIGAIIISVGVCALLRGKAKEDEIKERCSLESSASYNDENTPLLQG